MVISTRDDNVANVYKTFNTVNQIMYMKCKWPSFQCKQVLSNIGII